MALRVAQVAPLWENIPPEKYGGTERIVYFLTEGLVKNGHDVTLFAPATSKTSARLVSVVSRPLVVDNIPWTNIMYPLLNMTEAFDHADDFDLIHIHLNKSSDYLSLPLAVPYKKKVVFTLHFPYPTSHSASQQRLDRHAVLQKYKGLNFISISNSQRRGGENLNWIGTVYNGISLADFTLNETPEDYFLWLGKFNPDKGTKEAILAAQKAGVKLLIAGKIDHLEGEDFRYYHEEIQPLVDGNQIKFVGEVGTEEKNKLYGNAKGFLNPIQWNEPFGLVMAESMATGTPVISYRQGAAPEIIIEGKTGFLVDTLDEMASKIKEISFISRQACRARVEELFSVEKMVDGYSRLYEHL